MPSYTRSDLQLSQLPSLIELIEINLSDLGLVDDIKIFNDWNEEHSNGLLRWNNLDYSPFPCAFRNFEKTVQGASPRPSLEVSNLKAIPPYSKTLSQIAFENEDLLKVSVQRYQVWREDLATPPSNTNSAGFLLDDYRIIGVDIDNELQITFSLASVVDLPSVKLPSRMMVRNIFPALDKYAR